MICNSNNHNIMYNMSIMCTNVLILSFVFIFFVKKILIKTCFIFVFVFVWVCVPMIALFSTVWIYTISLLVFVTLLKRDKCVWWKGINYPPPTENPAVLLLLLLPVVVRLAQSSWKSLLILTRLVILLHFYWNFTCCCCNIYVQYHAIYTVEKCTSVFCKKAWVCV